MSARVEWGRMRRRHKPSLHEAGAACPRCACCGAAVQLVGRNLTWACKCGGRAPCDWCRSCPGHCDCGPTAPPPHKRPHRAVWLVAGQQPFKLSRFDGTTLLEPPVPGFRLPPCTEEYDMDALESRLRLTISQILRDTLPRMVREELDAWAAAHTPKRAPRAHQDAPRPRLAGHCTRPQAMGMPQHPKHRGRSYCQDYVPTVTPGQSTEAPAPNF